MKKYRLQYVLIIISIILLLLNFYSGYNQNDYNYFGMISNVLLIVAMVLTIRENKKTKNWN